MEGFVANSKTNSNQQNEKENKTKILSTPKIEESYRLD